MRELLCILATLLLGAPSAANAGADLTAGSSAPDFVLEGSDGRSYSLSEFVGKRELVLAWFPKAFTPG